MKVARPALVGLVSWLAVVAVGSTLVWTVISHVGDGLVTVAEPRPGASGSVVAGAVDAAPGRSQSSRPGQTITPSSKPSASPSAAASSGATGPSPTDSAAPSTVPVSPSSLPSPDRPSQGSDPTPSASSSSPPAPTPRRATWQGLGGTVEAECRGSAISQVAVQPSEGFRAEVKKAGPEELEVEFEGREEESGSGSKVSARCQGGEPRFSSETADAEDDD
ncbi:hypothetical protein [Nocardioides psychrotolerans]|uniref:hypothetical protein n=1 Tax=Nocardioides psychrotolerans TaxID=1005945 RepID=UPI0031383F75